MGDIRLLGEDIGFVNASMGYLFLIMFRVQALATGNVDMIRLCAINVTPAPVKLAIYDDDAGSPNSLLSYTDEIDVVRWYSDNAIPSTAIVSGQYYWIAIASSENFSLGGKVGGGTVLRKSIEYSDGYMFPNPAGSGYSQYDRQLSESGWSTSGGAGRLISGPGRHPLISGPGNHPLISSGRGGNALIG